jgi:hypothetical protein
MPRAFEMCTVRWWFIYHLCIYVFTLLQLRLRDVIIAVFWDTLTQSILCLSHCDMFKNRVLRRMFRLKREKVIGGWRKINDGELHNLFSSSNIVRVIKSRRMRCAGCVACMGKVRNAYRTLVRNPEMHLGDQA